MALETTDLYDTKTTWTVKQSIIIAIISLLIGISIFALAYVGMAHHTGIGSFDKPVLSWMTSHRSPQITSAMKLITTAASPFIFAAIICIGATIWAVSKREIWRPFTLVVSISVAAVISTVLKIITANGRPPHMDMVLPLELDYSFPSGHTIGVIVCLLVLGYLVYSRRSSGLRIFGWVVTTTLGVALIAISRLYLGYHWLTDITASIGLGFIILALVIAIDLIFVHYTKS